MMVWSMLYKRGATIYFCQSFKSKTRREQVLWKNKFRWGNESVFFVNGFPRKLVFCSIVNFSSRFEILTLDKYFLHNTERDSEYSVFILFLRSAVLEWNWLVMIQWGQCCSEMFGIFTGK